jgi:hypothetical protein
MSVQGRPPRASVRRPPGEVKALEGSATPTSGALAVAALQLGMSEQDIFDLALARSAWRSMVVVRQEPATPVSHGPRPRCRR